MRGEKRQRDGMLSGSFVAAWMPQSRDSEPTWAVIQDGLQRDVLLSFIQSKLLFSLLISAQHGCSEKLCFIWLYSSGCTIFCCLNSYYWCIWVSTDSFSSWMVPVTSMGQKQNLPLAGPGQGLDILWHPEVSLIPTGSIPEGNADCLSIL